MRPLTLLVALLTPLAGCCRSGPPAGPRAHVRIDNQTGKNIRLYSLGIQDERINYTTAFPPVAAGAQSPYQDICAEPLGCYSRASFQLDGVAGWQNPAHYPPSIDIVDKKVPRVLTGSTLTQLRPGAYYTFSYRLVNGQAVLTAHEDKPAP